MRSAPTIGASTQRYTAGIVRPLSERDIPRVVELHAGMFRKTNGAAARLLPENLSRLLLHHPWYDESLPSLVCEDAQGNIVGCIGVMPHPMSFNGREITAAISHSFIVEPGSRSTLAAFELAKRFLAGRQDLSLAEGSSVSRRIWEQFGGSTSLFYSLRWTRPLRPSRYVLSVLSRRGLSRTWGGVLRPACQLVDGIASLIARNSFHVPKPTVSMGELDAPAWCRAVSEFTSRRSLRPLYDTSSANWMLAALAERNGHGALRKVIVQNSSGAAVGWYLYYRNAGSIAEVLQIGARDGFAGDVLDHLFYDAMEHDAVAVSGQVDPVFFEALAKRNCLFHSDGGSWMLIHSQRPELIEAIHRGDAFLSRLDGEWWISFLLG